MFNGIKNQLSILSIRQKMFWTLTCIISVILLFSYSLIYLLFNKASEKQLIQAQNSAVSINSILINSYVDSIRQTTLQLIGDEAIGRYLSFSDLSNTLERLQTRESIINQFSHYSTVQILNNNQGYRNTLFLNSELPISGSFEVFNLNSNPYVRSGNVFSNEEVMDTFWYKRLMTGNKNTFVFINKISDEFCFAQKINNNYYSGPTYQNGLGVMVVSIKISQLEKNLSYTPITNNSGFAILNEDGTLLYQNTDTLSPETFSYFNLHGPKKSLKDNPIEQPMLSYEGKNYLSSVTNLNYGLRIVFLTPYSDIEDSIAPLMRQYLTFVFAIVILTMIILYLLSQKLTKPLIAFSGTLEHIADTRTFDKKRLFVAKGKELHILAQSFSDLIDRNNQLIDNIQKENEYKKQSELRALQAQINPHFLFNTMDVVNWIALSRNQDDIANIMSSIANMMRYTITEADLMVPLQRELDHIQEYISIYKLRHSGSIKLHVEGKISPAEFQIPKFTLQPLVENSIRHGMYEDDRQLNIWISTHKDGELYSIEVLDDGVGGDPKLLNEFLQYQPVDLKVSNGFGIRNVNERIELNFGGKSGLQYGTNEKGQLFARIMLDYKYRKSDLQNRTTPSTPQ